MSGWPYNVPRIQNPDGTTNVHCRKCGRIISKRVNPLIRTVTECAICQGYPEENVLAQYVQTDLTKPPTPIHETDPIFLYEDEAKAAKENKPWTGILKPLFRALGIGTDKEQPEAPVEKPKELRSKKIAKSKRTGGLFER